MPNGKTHRKVGAVAGCGYAYFQAQGQGSERVAIEMVGGALGGCLGAVLPDVFDPPLHPGHRSLAHGAVPTLAAGKTCIRQIDSWQTRLRSEADRHALLSVHATSEWERTWHAFLELLCRLCAGAVAGFIAGYGSHVVLDSMTPKGVPLFA